MAGLNLMGAGAKGSRAERAPYAAFSGEYERALPVDDAIEGRFGRGVARRVYNSRAGRACYARPAPYQVPTRQPTWSARPALLCPWMSLTVLSQAWEKDPGAGKIAECSKALKRWPFILALHEASCHRVARQTEIPSGYERRTPGYKS